MAETAPDGVVVASDKKASAAAEDIELLILDKLPPGKAPQPKRENTQDEVALQRPQPKKVNTTRRKGEPEPRGDIPEVAQLAESGQPSDTDVLAPDIPSSIRSSDARHPGRHAVPPLRPQRHPQRRPQLHHRHG